VQRIFNQTGDNTFVENIFVKLGMRLEIHKEKAKVQKEDKRGQRSAEAKYQIFYANTRADKKIEVSDFVGHFRARYQQIQRILMQRPDLQGLISINKISSERQSLSLIGIVTEKRITKNKNIILRFEDLTGEISAVARADRADVFTKAEELQLDDVVAVKASGNRDMLFIHDIYFPDAFIQEKARFEEEVSAAFISDVHCGSDRHLAQSFERFLEWLNSDDEQARKIRYLFIVGDNVDGVGIYPAQENFLAIKSMKLQYALLASYLSRVPRSITMFMCPGQHDASRVAEPQPIVDKRYASELYKIENLVLVTNPSLVKLIEGEREFNVLMYHGASIHPLIDNIKELRESGAHKTPAKAVKHMLKRRHIAPTHSSVVYIPNADKDPLVIEQVPDIFCTGEVHRQDIDTYNGVLIITGSCWQARTPHEERVGNIPDPAKVPILNLKTRELKILDFGIEEEINKKY
jgi:DNA polymerase II small subunit